MKRLMFIGLLLFAGCESREGSWRNPNKSIVCVGGAEHKWGKWEDCGKASTEWGDSSIEQKRHCDICGRVQIEWHR